MKRRHYRRIRLSGMKVYIVDCTGMCNGTLKNMSCFELCISDIPRGLQLGDGLMDVVVYGRGYSFKLQLRLKWELVTGQTRTVGATIENVPWDWAEFCSQQELMSSGTPIGTVSRTEVIAGPKGPVQP